MQSEGGDGASQKAAGNAPRRAFGVPIAGDRLDFAIGAIAILTLLRFILGAVLPLSFDEAYYWLWSRHLAAGYYDHPPAIAYAIWLGTHLFGDSAFGVRAVALILSVVASWAVWQSARILLGTEQAGARACFYFNLTLMVAAETMAATPDALMLAGASLLLLSLSKLATGGVGRWWIAAGIAGGFCLLSKYTGFFLGLGVLLWLVATREGRRWLLTPWPYLGGAISLALFAPVIAWNASHAWISFKFQFGRVSQGGWAPRYLGEFLLAQAALASPFLLVLAAGGFARGSRFGSRAALAAMLVWPSVLYFVVHALHDRVQGNWPSFLYPALAVLASFAATQNWAGDFARSAMAISRRLATPVAALILAAVYLQAFFAIVPSRDPIARLTAVNFGPVAARIESLAKAEHAKAVLTASYATTSWLAYYLQSALPVVQVNEGFRWTGTPAADPRLARGPLLFVTLDRSHGVEQIAPRFSSIRLIGVADRQRDDTLIEKYDIYEVTGFRGGTLGREP